MQTPVDLTEEQKKEATAHLRTIKADALAAAKADPTHPSRMYFGLPTGRKAQDSPISSPEQGSEQ